MEDRLGLLCLQGYGWTQWENDVRRWEMETGLSYEQV